MPLSQYWNNFADLCSSRTPVCLFVCNQPSLANVNIMDSKVYVCRIKYVMCRIKYVRCVG